MKCKFDYGKPCKLGWMNGWFTCSISIGGRMFSKSLPNHHVLCSTQTPDRMKISGWHAFICSTRRRLERMSESSDHVRLKIRSWLNPTSKRTCSPNEIIILLPCFSANNSIWILPVPFVYFCLFSFHSIPFWIWRQKFDVTQFSSFVLFIK